MYTDAKQRWSLSYPVVHEPWCLFQAGFYAGIIEQIAKRRLTFPPNSETFEQCTAELQEAQKNLRNFCKEYNLDVQVHCIIPFAPGNDSSIT